MAQGLHPAVLPSEAWWSVALALDASAHEDDRAAAAQAARRARQWIEEARLPEGEAPTTRELFRERHPLHAAVLGRGPGSR